MWRRRVVSALKPCYSPFDHRGGERSGVGKTMAATGSVDESDVGILCYISSLPGFRGILKQRYADFIVNEVDLDGNVVHLTSLEAPPESFQVIDEGEIKLSDELSRNYDSEIEAFRVLTGDSNAALLKDLVDKIASSSEESNSPIVLSPSSDKIYRTAVHNYFKEKFKFLVTDTVDGSDASTKCIRVRVNAGGQTTGNSSKKRKARGDKPFDSRGTTSWPDNVGKFLRFHLYKENKETQEALGLLGKMLGIQSKSFGFVGTKDKRAVSTQRVTVFKQSARRLVALNEKLIGIKVGDFCYVKEGLLLGQLLGNRFTVVLRDVIADSEDSIGAAADALGKFGFVNYFGLQRFGSSSVPTHLVGAALLKGEWTSALRMILDPRKGDTQKNDIAKTREYYKESGDIDGTLRQLPRHLVAERAILQCLKKCPGNHLQALKAIPRTLRMMYVHSYQSYLWNHAASMRVKKYGVSQVEVGDLVYCHRDKAPDVVRADNCEYGNDTSDDGGDMLDEASGMDLPVGGNYPIKVVTPEDISSGNYMVDDIVLPLPGSRVIYPTNDVAQVFEKLAKKDSINLKESVHNVKEFSIASVTGGYRRVFQKPIDFEWELLRYSNFVTPLAETDLDVIDKSKPLVSVETKCDPNGSADEKYSGFQLIHEDGINASQYIVEDTSPQSTAKKVALKLGFSLPSSCYATMAIRELLKTSTSVSAAVRLEPILWDTYR